MKGELPLIEQTDKILTGDAEKIGCLLRSAILRRRRDVQGLAIGKVVENSTEKLEVVLGEFETMTIPFSGGTSSGRQEAA